jgi:MYXO-CTERM domain-containing protein
MRPTRTPLFVVAVCVFAIAVLTSESSFGEMIGGSDFSSTPDFNGGTGTDDLDNVNTDDLNLADNITVNNWAFSADGKFEGWDDNAQVGMPNPVVTKLDGEDVTSLGSVGGPLPTSRSAHFTIDIPADTVLDLTSVTWDWRQATGADNTRALAFHTNLDTTLIFKETGPIRDEFDSEVITLSDAKYKGLTNQSVTFYWYAGEGSGTHDIDIDTIIVNGDVTQVPEPSTFALAALGLLGLIGFGRRRRRRTA